MERVRRPGVVEKVRRRSVAKAASTGRACQVIATPIGPLTLVADDDGLIAIEFGKPTSKSASEPTSSQRKVLAATEKQLREYFAGRRTEFDLPLAPEGTEFQRRVWRELSRIPYGKRITYGEQAKRLARPSAARAVGAANGRNPLPIVVPCHRVVGSTGNLTGFAGGLKIKAQLLELEQATIAKS